MPDSFLGLCLLLCMEGCQILWKSCILHRLFSLCYDFLPGYQVWQYWLWSFQTGGTKLERFLPKNQHTQRKLLNFENCVSGEVSKIGHRFSR